jgi:hypothetical protein
MSLEEVSERLWVVHALRETLRRADVLGDVRVMIEDCLRRREANCAAAEAAYLAGGGDAGALARLRERIAPASNNNKTLPH